jgi:anti-anti-sigma factor
VSRISTSEVPMMSLSPTVDFGVSVSAGSDEVVLHLRGEADLATAPLLQEALASPLASNLSYQRLVLDFEELSFIDSHCIGIIDDARTDLSQVGRDLTVRSPAPIARRVLGICGMSGMIEGAERPIRSPACMVAAATAPTATDVCGRSSSMR